MAQTTVEALSELALYGRRIPDFGARIVDLFNERPVIARLDVDAVVTGQAKQVHFKDEPSEWLLGVLAALRALYGDANDLSDIEGHCRSQDRVSFSASDDATA